MGIGMGFIFMGMWLNVVYVEMGLMFTTDVK